MLRFLVLSVSALLSGMEQRNIFSGLHVILKDLSSQVFTIYRIDHILDQRNCHIYIHVVTENANMSSFKFPDHGKYPWLRMG